MEKIDSGAKELQRLVDYEENGLLTRNELERLQKELVIATYEQGELGAQGIAQTTKLGYDFVANTLSEYHRSPRGIINVTE